MWTRFGTPTAKARSGTEEEYERARQAWKRKHKHKPSVMFYFRTGAPRALSKIDPAQLQQVNDFKKRVFKDNLAREYATPKEFQASDASTSSTKLCHPDAQRSETAPYPGHA